jgi:hypothetical protein
MNRFLFYSVQESFLVKPTLGFDLIKAGIDVRGSGKSSEWTGLVALPVFGISTTFPINVGLSIEAALVGTKINSGSKAILLSDFELKLNHRIDKHHQLSLGYVKSRVLIQGTYSDFFSQIKLNQSSPSFQYRYWF